MTATRTSVRSVLTDAAARAPSAPGVYVFLGSQTELLYIGKARDLRRRLRDHARNGTRARVRDVRWIECNDEAEALCLEADLVVALAPPFNATMAGESYEFLSVRYGKGIATFRLTRERPTGRHAYGGFAQLGKGKVSWAAVRCKAGYSGLLRLVWNAYDGSPFPSRLHGDSPPVEHETPIDEGGLRLLHTFLSGRSSRLLPALQASVDSSPPFMQLGLRRDVEGAEQFYWLGPCRVRRLRLRHGLRSPVGEEDFRRALIADLRDAIGDFVLG